MNEETFFIEQDIERLKRRERAINETLINKVSLSNGLLKDKGNLLLGSFKASEWVIDGCTATDSANTPEGIGLCTEFNLTQQYVGNTIPVDFDISDANTLGFWVWVEDPYALANVLIRLSGSTTSSDMTNCYHTGFLFPTDRLSEGWNYIKILKNNLTVVGTPLNRIRTVKIELAKLNFYYDHNLVATAIPVVSTKVRFGGLWKNPRGIGAKVLLEFDAISPELKTCIPLLQAKGMKASIFGATKGIKEQTTFLTKAELDDLYFNKGWDICNDTYSRLGNFATLTAQQITDELQNGITSLIEAGYSRGALHGASANNYTDNTSLNIIRALGFKTFRGSKNRPFNQFVVSNNTTGLLNYPIKQMGSGTTQQNIKDWLNEAIALETPICIFGHGVQASPDGFHNTLAIQQFLIDEIYARGLETITISELYDSLV